MSKPLLMIDNTMKQSTWAGLYGSTLALALAEYCQQTPGIKLLITPDNWYAQQLQDALTFFASDQDIVIFPDWETLPYDHFSPHQDIISERLSVLYRIQQAKDAIIIGSAASLMHQLCPPSFVLQHSLVLKCQQNLDSGLLRQHLLEGGYRAVNTVLEHGEFASRGSLLDVFPMGSRLPYRIELFDDTIESLRRFDPQTQRTIDKLDSIAILPAREVPLDAKGIRQFQKAFQQEFSGNLDQFPLYTDLSEGQIPGGIEYFLPLFFENTASFFDYLPPNSSICLIESIPNAAEKFWHEVTTRYAQRAHDVTRPILAPDRCFFSPTDLLGLSKRYPRIKLSQKPNSSPKYNVQVNIPPELPIARHDSEPLRLLSQWLQKPGRRYLLVVESAGRREVVLDLLKQSGIIPKMQASWTSFLQDQNSASIHITLGSLSAGAEVENISILVESQWFETTPQQRRLANKTIAPDLIIRSLAELHIGSPVVHLEFGVGRYQGLQSFTHDGLCNEFLILSYADGDKIYVPVTALHRISRYTGTDEAHAPLHRLGSDHWQKEKKKALVKIHDVAVDLLENYAKREQAIGQACNFYELDYQRFAAGFPFTLTADQSSAIAQIIHDMQAAKPMDRLICGDVGFGKTEVALRAAFIAARDGKQVCILTPTTLLAEQHFTTFRDRFADYPVTIELLSRFRTKDAATKVVQGIAKGTIDIVIGTHKLLQTSVHFNKLGLLIIDEEHRFGVKQKETIKRLRSNIDVLCMTATPIPRTLNMAMAGIRDISLIATPPAKRLAIKTFWQERSDSTIVEAILREILRGGQVFFLHNKVQTIDRVVQDLQQLVPQAKIRSAHGQMRERDLERIMADFYHHQFNVLVCTTIIETGIDIPTANTILIDRADTFGLAQLHQLRGRVGRSHHQAYAYLLTAPAKELTPDAVKRLEALVSLEELGAGFTLASHDLEIRGAGELLGEEQSGNMHAIGFHLFMELLEKAVADLKSGKIPTLEVSHGEGTEINLGISTIIPESYIYDIHTRLMMYKRIAHAKSKDELRDLHIELIDRFGLLPPSVKNLLAVTQLRFLANRLGIVRIQANPSNGKIEFQENPSIDSAKLIQLIQTQSQRYQLKGPTCLCFGFNATEEPAKIEEVASLLGYLK